MIYIRNVSDSIAVIERRCVRTKLRAKEARVVVDDTINHVRQFGVSVEC